MEVGATVDVRRMLGLDKRPRFELTEAEIIVAAESRRQNLERRLPQLSSPGKDQSIFEGSIAAAMEVRKLERESLLLKRIQKQRTQDSQNPALVEKDMAVGVFVTPAYKEMMQRQRRTSGTQSGVSTSSAVTVKEDEEEDPLAAYLKELEARQPGYATGKIPTSSEGVDVNATSAVSSGEAQVASRGSADVAAVEGQPVVTQMAEDPVCGLATGPPSAIPLAVAADHHRTVMIGREARKRQRVDTVFIAACALRCEERIRRCLCK